MAIASRPRPLRALLTLAFAATALYAKQSLSYDELDFSGSLPEGPAHRWNLDDVKCEFSLVDMLTKRQFVFDRATVDTLPTDVPQEQLVAEPTRFSCRLPCPAVILESSQLRSALRLKPIGGYKLDEGLVSLDLSLTGLRLPLPTAPGVPVATSWSRVVRGTISDTKHKTSSLVAIPSDPRRQISIDCKVD